MLPSAIILDAFGTVIEIKHRTNPYKMLLREGARQGRIPTGDDLHTLMTTNCTIAQAADVLSIRISASRREVIQEALDEELDSLEPFSDALEAIEMLSDAGIRIGVCSNLAAPFGAGLKQCFHRVDAFTLSYEIGVMKPHSLIYEVMCASLGVQPGRDWLQGASSVLMIGDSPKCDRDGPRAVGISGFLLDRTKGSAIPDLVHFANMVLAGQQS